MKLSGGTGCANVNVVIATQRCGGRRGIALSAARRNFFP